MSDKFTPFRSKVSRSKFLSYLDSLESSWPVQYEGNSVPTTVGETFVRSSGPEDAPPVVVLPGGQSNTLVWRRLNAPLSTHKRIFVVDAIYDQGRSVPTQPVRNADELRQWLDEVFDGLGLDKGITMVGQSYGCYASAEYALHAQERLSKLIWIAPVMIGAPIAKEFVERLRLVADGSRESLQAFCRWIMPSLASNYPDNFNQRIDEILLVRECYNEPIPPVRAAVMSDDDLRQITTPTFYILGEKDGATDDTRKAIERVASLMPQVETLLVPNAGHDLVASHTELVIERLLNFS